MMIQKSMVEASGDFTIYKAWQEGNDTFFEAWMSQSNKDRERDIVPPEAFAGAIDDYMAANGPLSSEHNLHATPIGHIRRIALVNDGAIFQEATHPTDTAQFEHFPMAGTGVYVSGVINESTEARGVAKGNIGGMSWVGKLRRYEKLPDGGKKYLEIYPLVESTISAYPINPKAAFVKVKAADETPQEEENEEQEMENMLDSLQTQLTELLAKIEASTASNDEKMKATLEAFKLEMIDEMPMKARQQGVGRKGVVSIDNERDTNPAEYIAKASQHPETMSPEDKELAFQIMFSALVTGMKGE